ncbi:hypothetical protein KFE98_17525 [bacterium SCSIO 12741]|nr:hypothetical protein KFE98_17525 [bacterium SCSIO 12741]
MSYDEYNEVGLKEYAEISYAGTFSHGSYCIDKYWKQYGVKGCIKVYLNPDDTLDFQLEVKTKYLSAIFTSPLFRKVAKKKKVAWYPQFPSTPKDKEQKELRIVISYDNVRKEGDKLKVDVSVSIEKIIMGVWVPYKFTETLEMPWVEELAELPQGLSDAYRRYVEDKSCHCS